MELNKIYFEECLSGMSKMPAASVDMILCDLPYGTTACKWDVIIPFMPLWEQYYRVLRPNGFAVFTASQPFTTQLIASNIERFSHQWVWQKPNGSNPLMANKAPMKNFEDVVVFSNEYAKHDVEGFHPLRPYAKRIFDFIGKTKREIFSDLGNQSICHFMRVDSTQFSICTAETYSRLTSLYGIDKMDGFMDFDRISAINAEYRKSLIEEFDAKFPRVYNPQKTKGDKYVRRKNRHYIAVLDDFMEYGDDTETDERFPTSIIKFPNEVGLHPTQKPVALFEYLVKTYTNEGDTVLDNCMGSGTTAIACINTGRNFIGFENDPKYFDIAQARIAERLKPREPKSQGELF